MRPLFYAFLAGLTGACGFEPLALWPLTILSFAALLWLVEDSPSLRSALARGWWFAVGHFVLGLNWIATAFTYQAAMPAWLGWVSVVLLSLYLAVYPALAAGLAWRWGRGDRFRLALVFAAAWVATEWLRATMFTGFAWNPEAVVLIDSWISRAATMIGTYGLSGLLMLIAGLIHVLARRPGWVRYPLIAAVLLALPVDLKLVDRGDQAELARQPALRIVQPNIGQQDKWKDGFEEVNFARLTRLSQHSTSRPRLLLWPEAAVTDPLEDARIHPYYRREQARLRDRVATLLRPGDLLLTGGVTFKSRDGERLTGATNSVFGIDASGRILGRYDKAHLVPYGEYLPARPILSAIGLSRLAPGDIDFAPGPGPRSIDLPLVGRVGFQLCYEIIFSGDVVDKAHRPRFLFNPSNDAWFGRFGPPQHLAQARLRALEEGLPVLRSTPTGISAVIDADGRLVASLPWRQAGVIDTVLPAPKPPTPFARFGNILPFVFALLLAATAIAIGRKRRYGPGI